MDVPGAAWSCIELWGMFSLPVHPEAAGEMDGLSLRTGPGNGESATVFEKDMVRCFVTLGTSDINICNPGKVALGCSSAS